MAIYSDFIGLDARLTGRSEAALNTRGRQARKGGLLPIHGRGRHGAHLTSHETANYIIASLAPGVSASKLADEIRDYNELVMADESWQALIANEMWHGGNVPPGLKNFGWALQWLVELAGDKKRLESEAYKALDDRYEGGHLTLRKSVDTRDATLTLSPRDENEPVLHIKYDSPAPEMFSVDEPIWTSAAASLGFVAAFGRLIAEGGDA